jgi:DNA-binding response OmpR family regulator
MARALQKAGYQVITALNGQDGLMKAFRDRPHCLILDVVLPGGMSGFGLCRQLRSIDPRHTLSIILVSTKNTPLDHNWAIRQGADRYLIKPFTEELFLRTVEEVLAERLV